MKKKERGFEGEHPMVRVEWEDSAGLGHWRDLEEIKKEEPLNIVSIGYLLRDDGACITLAGSYDQERKPGSRRVPNVGEAHTIPRSGVKKIEYLRVSSRGAASGGLSTPAERKGS